MATPQKRRRRWFVLLALAFLLTATSYILQILVPDVPETARLDWWIFDAPQRGTLLAAGAGAQALAVAAPLVLAYREAVEAAAARAAAGEGELRRQTEINGILTPLASVLGELSELDGRAAAKRAELRGQAKTTVLAGLSNLFGDTARVRACYFQLRGDHPNRRLEPAGNWGKGRPDTTTPFVEGTPAGDESLASLDRGKARYWRRDQPGSPPPGWDNAKAYTTFISVPVLTKEKVLGMLTIDAPDNDTFAFPGDVHTVELFARLLAVALKT